MTDDSLYGYLPLYDSNHSQAYINAMNAMKPIDRSDYTLQYHHSILDDDNVSDSIKVRVLYNELTKLKTELANTKRNLTSDINMLNLDHRRLTEENKRLSDEIASIKQALYFG